MLSRFSATRQLVISQLHVRVRPCVRKPAVVKWRERVSACQHERCMHVCTLVCPHSFCGGGENGRNANDQEAKPPGCPPEKLKGIAGPRTCLLSLPQRLTPLHALGRGPGPSKPMNFKEGRINPSIMTTFGHVLVAFPCSNASRPCTLWGRSQGLFCHIYLGIFGNQRWP